MSWSDYETRWFITYYVISVLSISGSILVAISILWSKKISTPFSKIVLMIHLSLMVDEISLLPYVYSNSIAMCTIMQTLHNYSTLVNHCALFVLVQAHLFNALEHWRTSLSSLLIEKYGIYWVLTFPTIVLIWFVDRRYYEFAYPFCLYPPNQTEPLFLWTFYFWRYLLLFTCGVEVIFSTYYIYSHTDSWMAVRYFSTVGCYLFVAVVGLLPSMVAGLIYINDDNNNDNLSIDAAMTAFLPVYLSGILYTFIFYFDREAIENFELYQQLHPTVSRATVDMTDILRLVDEVERKEAEEDNSISGEEGPGVKMTALNNSNNSKKQSNSVNSNFSLNSAKTDVENPILK